MNRYATLGPTDPQTTILAKDQKNTFSYPILQLIEESIDVDMKNLQILQILHHSKMCYVENIFFINEFFEKHKKKNITDEQLKKIIHIFAGGEISHNTEINAMFLKDYINITIGIPESIQQIYDKFDTLFYSL